MGILHFHECFFLRQDFTLSKILTLSGNPAYSFFSLSFFLKYPLSKKLL